MNSPKQSLAALAVLALVSSTGCAHLPDTGAVATGEPLTVRTRTIHGSYVVKEQVGEVEHRDADGRSLGTSAVYRNAQRAYAYDVWKGYQGETPLDDEDFLRLSGDATGAQMIAEKRERGMTLNRIGLAAIGVGAALGVAAIVVRPGKDQDGNRPSSPLSTGLMLGGVIGAGGGLSLAYLGAGQTNAEHPLDDVSRFQQAADHKLHAALQASFLPPLRSGQAASTQTR